LVADREGNSKQRSARFSSRQLEKIREDRLV